MFNANNYPNLFNLFNVINVTTQPIIVHDDDAGEDYDITELIKAAYAELNNN